jgi:hypothetical protein
MVAATSTSPAGCLIRFVLVNLSLGDSGQCFAVALELLLLVTPGCTVRFPPLILATVVLSAG